MYPQKHLNNKGVGILEVVVVSAIMLTLALGISTLLTNAVQIQRGIQAKDVQRELLNEIRFLLSDNDACVNSLGPVNNSNAAVTTPYNVTNLRDTANAIKYSVGSVDSGRFVTFTQMRVMNWAASSPTRGTFSLRVVLTKTGKIIGPSVMAQDLTVQAIVNGSNRITACSYLGSADSLWQKSTTVPEDIYYNGGNVGIGTATPTEVLEVVGNVLATAFFWASDERLKESKTSAQGLSVVEKLNGYKFVWKDTGKQDYGVMAQEVESLLPELIREENNGTKHVNYAGLMAPMIEATKELAQKQRTMEERLADMEAQLRELQKSCTPSGKSNSRKK